MICRLRARTARALAARARLLGDVLPRDRRRRPRRVDPQAHAAPRRGPAVPDGAAALQACPSPRAVVQRMRRARGEAFLVRAGTLILATSVVIWALSYFPHDASIGAERDRAVAAGRRDPSRPPRPRRPAARRWPPRGRRPTTRAPRRSVSPNGAWLRAQLLGRAGRVDRAGLRAHRLGLEGRRRRARVVPRPRGRRRRRSASSTTSTRTRTRSRRRFGTASATPAGRTGPRAGQPVFDIGSALALMVFFALCMQCVSTLSVMRKETGSWRWPAFAFGYMTTLAYVGALPRRRRSCGRSSRDRRSPSPCDDGAALGRRRPRRRSGWLAAAAARASRKKRGGGLRLPVGGVAAGRRARRGTTSRPRRPGRSRSGTTEAGPPREPRGATPSLGRTARALRRGGVRPVRPREHSSS